jgi:hypothetical protein
MTAAVAGTLPAASDLTEYPGFVAVEEQAPPK